MDLATVAWMGVGETMGRGKEDGHYTGIFRFTWNLSDILILKSNFNAKIPILNILTTKKQTNKNINTWQQTVQMTHTAVSRELANIWTAKHFVMWWYFQRPPRILASTVTVGSEFLTKGRQEMKRAWLRRRGSFYSHSAVHQINCGRKKMEQEKSFS